MQKLPATTAIVLAGGRSARMGRDKALLPFGGRPLIVRIVQTLSAVATEVIVVAAREQQLPPLDAMVIRDDVAHQGPLAGILYGLRAAASQSCFVTACDSPAPNAALIQHLFSLSPGHDIVVPVWRGRVQPLHAVYRPSLAPGFAQRLEEGRLRLMDAFEGRRVRRVEEEEIRRFDPDGVSFTTFNTPEEYDAAVRRVGNGHE